MLSTKIKKYLVENGIKQIFLSEKTGIPISKLNAMLNGKRKIPAEDYFLICEALNIDASELYNATA